MGACSKNMLFQGGVASVTGERDSKWPPSADDSRAGGAWEAFLEGAVKTVLALSVSAPKAREVVLSGRVATEDVRDAIAARLRRVHTPLRVQRLAGLGTIAKHAAQGAALLADGLSGGAAAPIVDRLGIRAAAGTVLDHLAVISPAAARRRLGMTESKDW
jgi:predicted butyrate kinase (DUF1464 family)